MKKKITIILSVALMVVLSCAMLIGCTPSNPGDYFTKWTENDKISYTYSTFKDTAEVFDSAQGKYVEAQYGGRTTTEFTFVKNEKMILFKVVEIYNIKDKNGKFWKKDAYRPRAAVIIEITKDGKYNVYNHELKIEKQSDKVDKLVEKNVWEAKQYTKEEMDQLGIYEQYNDQFKAFIEEAKAYAESFDSKFEKGKNGVYTSKEKDSNGNTWTCKISSGQLELKAIGDDEKIEEAYRYDMGNKIVIPSAAKGALKELLKK